MYYQGDEIKEQALNQSNQLQGTAIPAEIEAHFTEVDDQNFITLYATGLDMGR